MPTSKTTEEHLIATTNSVQTNAQGLPIKPSLPVQTLGIDRDGLIYGYGSSPQEPAFILPEDTGLCFFGKPILSLSYHVTRGKREPYLNIHLNTFAFDDQGNQANGVHSSAKNGLTILKMKCGNDPVQNAPVTFLGDLHRLHTIFNFPNSIDPQDYNGIIYTSKGSKGGIFAHIYSIDNQPLAGMPLSRDPERFKSELNELCHSLGQTALFPVNVDVIQPNSV